MSAPSHTIVNAYDNPRHLSADTIVYAEVKKDCSNLQEALQKLRDAVGSTGARPTLIFPKDAPLYKHSDTLKAAAGEGINWLADKPDGTSARDYLRANVRAAFATSAARPAPAPPVSPNPDIAAYFTPVYKTNKP